MALASALVVSCPTSWNELESYLRYRNAPAPCMASCRVGGTSALDNVCCMRLIIAHVAAVWLYILPAIQGFTLPADTLTHPTVL